MRNNISRVLLGLLTLVVSFALIMIPVAVNAEPGDKQDLKEQYDMLPLTQTTFDNVPSKKAGHIYAVIGDSIAAGVGAEIGFPTVAGVQSKGFSGRCLTKRCYLYNPMIGDLDIAVDGAEWANLEAMNPRPDTIILEMGINDMNTGSGSARVIAGMKLAREVAKDMGVRIVFATLIPPGKDAHPFNVLKARRDQVNTWVRKQNAYLDLDKATRNDYGQLRWTYNSGDDLHPNQAGQDAMALALQKFMAADQLKINKKNKKKSKK